MSSVSVEYLGLVRSLIGVRSEVIELQDGARVPLLFRALLAKYGDKLGYYVLDDESRLSGFARMLIDDVELADLPEGVDTVFKEGSRVVIMTIAPLSGG